jgi:uncharacterized 2Fe-2S/4Fe-4S cluster protein (DUF4445 family)
MSNDRRHTVIFLPSGRRGRFPTGVTLLEVARALGEPIESTCGGHLLCGKCQVRIETGDFTRLGVHSGPDHISPITEEERAWLNDVDASAGLRLACNARLRGDVVVFVPEQARIHQQTIRKAAGEIAIQVKPSIRQVYVKLEPPSLSHRQSDWERLQSALAVQWDLSPEGIALPALRRLQDALREGDWGVTVILSGHRVLDVRPGYAEGIWGLAVDIGSTTMAAYLSDLQTGALLASHAVMNPQVAYGEDLMSRISYASQNEDGLKKLHRAVVGAFNRLAGETAARAGIRQEEIHEAVVVGNTTMIALFLGIHPRYLGEAPFTLARRDPMDWPAGELKLRLHPAANVHILPAIAGHVGADNVAVLLAQEPETLESPALIIDVGTNAEIDLWDGEQLYAASSPTGPAFEGAQITFGMRAAPGAVERVRIDPDTLAVRFKVIGEPRWSDQWSAQEPPAVLPNGICGSGIIEAIAELFLAGVLLPDGRFNPDAASDRLRWQGKRGSFVLVRAEESAMGTDILITSEDVRAIQLAKAALYAGCKVLMEEAGVDQVARVVLAGAFGSYISPTHALVLGLFPDAPPEKVVAVGNAAGDGARIALLNQDKRAEAWRIAQSVRYVETATHPAFQEAFVKAIHLPHQEDAFPHIAHLLPTRASIPRARRRRRPRR